MRLHSEKKGSKRVLLSRGETFWFQVELFWVDVEPSEERVLPGTKNVFQSVLWGQPNNLFRF
jgi:hypothetical protein